MNILNENEAIVINSLENWEKVESLLHEKGIRFSTEFKPTINPFYIRLVGEHSLLRGELETLEDPCRQHLAKIQDTEFIAKHSKQNQTNMKIKVLKENGLLEVGKMYLFVFNEISKGWNIGAIYLPDACVVKWLKNGYIEEVKEVSYAWKDITSVTDFSNCYIAHIEVANEKQQQQMQAFAKLTHVRAKILKDAGYSEDWEPKKNEECFSIFWSLNSGIIDADSFPYRILTGAYLLFPTKELAELALQHNQELFKTYLGV